MGSVWAPRALPCGLEWAPGGLCVGSVRSPMFVMCLSRSGVMSPKAAPKVGPKAKSKAKAKEAGVCAPAEHVCGAISRGRTA